MTPPPEEGSPTTSFTCAALVNECGEGEEL